MSELYELLTFEAFGQRYPELTARHQILPGRGVFCKAERLQSGVIGTYAMPQRMAPTGEKHFFGYYLTEKKLLLVEKGSFLQGLLPGLPGETPAQLLSELLARAAGGGNGNLSCSPGGRRRTWKASSTTRSA